MKPGICFRSRKFESHIIFIGQSYFFKTNNTNQFSHVFKTGVGELFTSLGLFPFMQRDIIQGEMSPDDIRTSGMYDVGNSTTMPFNYGGLLVFNTKTLTIQTGVDLQGKTICIRVSWNNGPWSSWNNFTFNQQSI